MSRSLCAFGEESRHCQHPVERNIFFHGDLGLPTDPPTPTAPTDPGSPTPQPQPSSNNADSPSEAPTPAPTASAAPSSSASPTSAPTASAAPSSSASPTSAPTASAAPSSSASPTLAPTASAAPSSSASPTLAPTVSAAPSSSASPTSAPTASAAPSSSASPTLAPTASAAPSSSASPTSVDDRDPEFPDTCVSDDGNFGETDLSKADQIVTVGFNYQVQTTVMLRAENLNSEVLAQLEEALANLLVPALFNGNELCEFDRRRHLQSSNLAPAVGLLSAPADRILVGSEGVRCRTGLVGLAARCFIVKGGFTLLGNGDISWAGPLALMLTKEAMDEGKLNNVNPDVVDVKFLEALNTTIVFNNDTSARPSMSPTIGIIIDPDRNVQSIGSSDNIPGWSWALVSIGVIAFFVALWVLARKLGDRKERNDIGQFDPDESADMRSGMQSPIDADEGVAPSWNDVAASEGDDTYSDPLLPPENGARVI